MRQIPANLSVIVPVLNEEQTLASALDYFRLLRETCELVFVDGNSSDNTAAVLVQHGFFVINNSNANRGAQLYSGAEQASHENLLFHHFDSRLPKNFLNLITQALQSRAWGRFDVRLDSPDWRLRLVETAMNTRSRWTGVATGDQAMFMHKSALLACAGELQRYPVMEDIYLSKQLKKVSLPACLRARVLSSARYWHHNGVVRSTLKMWALRLLYFFGMRPQTLYRLYYGKR